MAKKTHVKVRLVPEAKPDSSYFYYVKKFGRSLGVQPPRPIRATNNATNSMPKSVLIISDT